MVNNELIKDDLYMAVNGDWLKTAKIPADKAATGGFYDLADDIEKTLKELLIEISNENNIKIIEMETDLDHIHILIECSPQHFIPNILKIFKGISARKLFLKHPEIKNKLWNGHLWNPSYFVATVSKNTEEQIKRYIQTQKER